MTTHIYIYLSKDYPAGGYVVDYHGYEDYFLSLLKIMSEKKIKKKKYTSYNIVPHWRIRNINENSRDIGPFSVRFARQ